MREVDFSVPVLSLQERMKLYNRKYRDEHSQIVHCACGSAFKEISKYTHLKTIAHQKFLEAKKTNGTALGDGRTDDIRSGNTFDTLQGDKTSTG